MSASAWAQAPVARYTSTAIALHWLLALLIVVAFGIGLAMHDLPVSPSRLRLFNLHKWIGSTVLALSLWRLLWRLAHRPPPAVPMPAWQARAAAAGHAALYALTLAVPLAGWAYSSAAGFPVVVFGVLPLPDFVPADRALSESLKPLHKLLAFALAALAFGHTVAALKHHLVDGDGLMHRMRPGRG